MDLSKLRQRYIALAAFFVTLGFLFLLNNFKAFTGVDFAVVLNLWPIAIILGGVYFLIRGHKFAWIITALTFFLLAISVFSYLAIAPLKIPFLPSISSRKSEVNPNINIRTSTEEVTGNIEKANLIFRSFSGQFAIRGTTDSLTEYETKSTFGEYLFDRSTKDGIETVDLRFDQERVPWKITSEKNSLDLKLSDKTKWNMDVDVDASDLSMELGYYKVENLRLKMTTSKADITFDEKSFDQNVNFEIDSSLSTTNIRVPKSIGVEVKLKSVASSNNLGDLKEVEKNKYQSDNFDSREKKLFLNIDTNLSNLKIELF